MPSISKAEHERLLANEDEVRRLALVEARLTDQIAKFERTLDNLLQAARGETIIDPRRSAARDGSNGLGNYITSFSGNTYNPTEPEPTEVVRLRTELADLRDYRIGLEQRLAAVTAVAQYAKAQIR